MSDLNASIETLIKLGCSPDEAMKIVAEVFNLGVAASAYRDAIHRVKRQTGGPLKIVAKDVGHKNHEGGE